MAHINLNTRGPFNFTLVSLPLNTASIATSHSCITPQKNAKANKYEFKVSTCSQNTGIWSWNLGNTYTQGSNDKDPISFGIDSTQDVNGDFSRLLQLTSSFNSTADRFVADFVGDDHYLSHFKVLDSEKDTGITECVFAKPVATKLGENTGGFSFHAASLNCTTYAASELSKGSFLIKVAGSGNTESIPTIPHDQ